MTHFKMAKLAERTRPKMEVLKGFFLILMTSGLSLTAQAREALSFEEASQYTSELCHNQGLTLSNGLKTRFSRKLSSVYDQWLDEAQKTNLTAPSMASGLDRFCSKNSPCGMTVNWYLSMHPDARVRRESVFETARLFAGKLDKKSQTFQSMSDIQNLLKKISRPNVHYSDAAINKSNLMTQKMYEKFSNKYTKMVYQLSRSLCLGASSSMACFKAMPTVFKILTPIEIQGQDLQNPAIFPLLLALPEQIKQFTQDPRYVTVLSRLNQSLIGKVMATENALDRGDSPAPIGNLYDDLKLQVRDVFQCHSQECEEEHSDLVLGIYGARGPSFMGLLNYYTSEQYPLFFQYGLFSTLLHYADALIFKAGMNGSGSYSMPFKEYSNCLAPKPYHFILPMVLARLAAREFREKDARLGVAEAVHRLTLAYQVYLHRPLKKAQAIFENQYSQPNNFIRLDLILDAFGVMKGLDAEFTIRPEVSLMSINKGNMRLDPYAMGYDLIDSKEKSPENISLSATVLWLKNLNLQPLGEMFPLAWD